MATDVQPPEFTLCPESVHAFSDENGFAIVDWPIPEAFDNSENADDCGGSIGITVSQVLGQAPRSNFEKGYHDITYTATDNNNNGGLCKFTVIVEGTMNITPLFNHKNELVQKFHAEVFLFFFPE